MVTDKELSKPRRKLLRTLAAGSGVVLTGTSLPDKWSRPVVDSVVLPAHAQTTGQDDKPRGDPEPTCSGGCFERTDTVGSVFWNTDTETVEFFGSTDCSGNSFYSSTAVVANSPSEAEPNLPCDITSVESINDFLNLSECNVYYCD